MVSRAHARPAASDGSNARVHAACYAMLQVPAEWMHVLLHPSRSGSSCCATRQHAVQIPALTPQPQPPPPLQERAHT